MTLLKLLSIAFAILTLILSYQLPKKSKDEKYKDPKNCYNFSGHLYYKSLLHYSILFLIIFYVLGGTNDNKSNSSKENSTTNKTEKPNKTDETTNSSSSNEKLVTFSEAEEFMQQRCNAVNQTLMKKKSVVFNGTKLYMFLSVAQDGQACISSVSEYKLEVLAADCGEAMVKIQQWNEVN